MDTNLLEKVQSVFKRKSMPNVAVGDTVEIKIAVRDEKGEKKRVQPFRGLVIAMKGAGTSQTMTVRKISDGIGVEKILPIHSPNLEEIKILKKGKVRQANIYYMRDRVGKRAMKVGDSDAKIEMVYEESEQFEEENVEVNATSEEVGTQEKKVEEKKDKPVVEEKQTEEKKEEIKEVSDEKKNDEVKE